MGDTAWIFAAPDRARVQGRAILAAVAEMLFLNGFQEV